LPCFNNNLPYAHRFTQFEIIEVIKSIGENEKMLYRGYSYNPKTKQLNK
jgi:hypothetical protein